MINDVVEVVDVDALSSDDPDVECKGYKRNLSKNAQFMRDLQDVGLTYAGYRKNAQNVPTKPKLRPNPSAEPEFIVIDSDSDDEAPVPMASGSRPPVQFPSPTEHMTLSQVLKRAMPASAKSGPPPKRIKRDSGSPNPALLNPMKRSFTAFKSPPVSDVISIPDSSDEEEPVMKKQRQTGDYIDDILEVDHMEIQPEPEHVIPVAIEEEDIGSDSDMSYAAYDLDVPSNWIDPPEPSTFLDINDDHQDDEDNDDLALQMSSLSVNNAGRERQLERLRRIQDAHNILNWTEEDGIYGCRGVPFFWTKLQLAARPTRRRRHYDNPFYHDSFPCYRRLQPVAPSFRSPGAINWIAQANGIVAIASAVTDGMADDDEEEPVVGPYNQKGSLRVWYEGRDVVLHGHNMRIGPRGKEHMKYYTINDVKFDPTCPTTLASAGADCKVRMWDCDRLRAGEKPIILDTVHYDCSPEALHFKPDDSLLAVSGEDGCIFLQHDSHTTKLIVAPQEVEHATADMVWGVGASSKFLFGSSAGRDDNTGLHKAFDVARNKMVCEFDAAKEAGERLAIDSVGGRLCIATMNADNAHVLRQFDTRRLMRRAVQKIDLEPFAPAPADRVQEVNRLAFSADGTYLAVARNDNTVHVYDSRMLDRRGALYVFAHDGDALAKDAYGVVEVQWVEDARSHGLGLISGGVDGSIRLWDVKKAHDDLSNGVVLAQGDYDVGHFSLGDTHEGEMALVVGELSGNVTVFDRTGRLDI